ncbi:MAG: hypothetical protein R3E55_10350 [Burkholderiaceae bacterium]
MGSLVCPALWDLGEDAKVVLLSVTEGEDKPLKYPDMFAARAAHAADQDRPAAAPQASTCSAAWTTRAASTPASASCSSRPPWAGMDAWLDWLLHPDAIEPTSSVQTRIAQLEAELARLKSGQG